MLTTAQLADSALYFPTVLYVAMPEGSSSDAPVISPGPIMLRTLASGFDCLLTASVRGASDSGSTILFCVASWSVIAMSMPFVTATLVALSLLRLI